MTLEAKNAEDLYNEMIMTELKNIRDDIKELRGDVKQINNNCSTRGLECGKTFLNFATYWKSTIIGYGVIGAIFTYVISIIK